MTVRGVPRRYVVLYNPTPEANGQALHGAGPFVSEARADAAAHTLSRLDGIYCDVVEIQPWRDVASFYGVRPT